MATWRAENSILTQRGVEILNKLKAGEGNISISRVVAGSGRVSVSSLFKQTTVSGTQKQMVISSKNATDNGSEINVHLTNTGFTESFNLNQIGIYVTHPAYVGEQLYHISQCDAEDFDTIPVEGDTPVTHGYSIFMEHGNSDSVTITVDPQGMISRTEFDEYTKKYPLSRFSIKSNNMTALSSVGWYRIASTDYSNSGNTNALLFLGHNFSNGGASGLLVSVNFQIYAPSIVVLNHKVSNLQFFDKIRLVRNESENKCYLDIHYNSSLANAVVAGMVYLDYNTPVNTLELTMKDFVVVEDEPVGGTILLTQNLSVTKNGTVLTSGNSPADIGALPIGLVDSAISVSSESDLDSKLDTIIASMENSKTKFVFVNFSVAHPILEGYTRIMRVDKILDSYCMIHSLSYSELNGVVLEHYRSKYNGKWTAWARGYNSSSKPTPSEIGALGAITNTAAGIDLNTFKSFSTQRVNSALNKPDGTGIYGLVWNIQTADSVYIVQYYLDASARKLYRRACVGDEWSSWISESSTPIVPATVEE